MTPKAKATVTNLTIAFPPLTAIGNYGAALTSEFKLRPVMDCVRVSTTATPQ